MRASCQSNVMESTVAPFHQKLRVPPEAGTVIVWYMEPSPFGTAPLSVPSSAENVPECAAALLTTGAGLVPSTTHGANVPVSKPPFWITVEAQGVG